jgi:hypothetical protein
MFGKEKLRSAWRWRWIGAAAAWSVAMSGCIMLQLSLTGKPATAVFYWDGPELPLRVAGEKSGASIISIVEGEQNHYKIICRNTTADRAMQCANKTIDHLSNYAISQLQPEQKIDEIFGLLSDPIAAPLLNDSVANRSPSALIAASIAVGIITAVLLGILFPVISSFGHNGHTKVCARPVIGAVRYNQPRKRLRMYWTQILKLVLNGIAITALLMACNDAYFMS